MTNNLRYSNMQKESRSQEMYPKVDVSHVIFFFFLRTKSRMIDILN